MQGLSLIFSENELQSFLFRDICIARGGLIVHYGIIILETLRAVLRMETSYYIPEALRAILQSPRVGILAISDGEDDGAIY